MEKYAVQTLYSNTAGYEDVSTKYPTWVIMGDM